MANQTIQIHLTVDELSELIKESVKEAVQVALAARGDSSSKYLTRKETALKLNISLPTLHRWTLKSRLRAYRIESRVLYKEKDIENDLSVMKVKI